MIVAVDTNIFLDVLRPNPDFLQSSKTLLETYGSSASLVISDIVYAELAVAFGKRLQLENFLDTLHVQVESLSRDASIAAARAWKQYRRAGGKRERILPDFLIGAHAMLQSQKLLSRDRGFYKSYFPELTVEAQAE